MRFDPTDFEYLEWPAGMQAINDCDYLYVRDVLELEELTLAVEIHEAKTQAPIVNTKDETPWGSLFSRARPIEVDDTCQVFRLIFDRDYMISYSVLNESYGKYPEPPEEFTGKLFRVFSSSHLLDFRRKYTYAINELTGPLQHYEVSCLNHVLDVVCTQPPRIAVRKQSIPIWRPN